MPGCVHIGNDNIYLVTNGEGVGALPFLAELEDSFGRVLPNLPGYLLDMLEILRLRASYHSLSMRRPREPGGSLLHSLVSDVHDHSEPTSQAAKIIKNNERSIKVVAGIGKIDAGKTADCTSTRYIAIWSQDKWGGLHCTRSRTVVWYATRPDGMMLFHLWTCVTLRLDDIPSCTTVSQNHELSAYILLHPLPLRHQDALILHF